MLLDLDGKGPLYLQLARAIEAGVKSGRLAEGHKLPATRELADELVVSRNTVRAAYEHLEANGLLEGRHGSGCYIRSPARDTGSRPRIAHVEPQSAYARRARAVPDYLIGRIHHGLRYNLQYGEPVTDALLSDVWRRELGHAALYTELGYAAVQGILPLRTAICDYLRRRRGILAEPDDVIIVAGTQQAISLSCRVLADEGQSAVLEDPCFYAARQILFAHGARVTPVPVDRHGLVTAQLPRRRPAFIFTTPSHQSPLGVVMSSTRRAELLAYATRQASWIVEDDYDAEIRFDARQVPPLKATDAESRVIYVGSFSKVLAPSLRLAYMIVPPGLKQDFINAKRLCDLGCPAIQQAALAHFMDTGGFERHLRRVVKALRERREALLTGLRKHVGEGLIVEDSHAGMHLIGWLPRSWAPRHQALMEAAAKLGVGLHPLTTHYIRPPARQGFLLGFAGLSATELDAACRLLGRAFAEFH